MKKLVDSMGYLRTFRDFYGKVYVIFQEYYLSLFIRNSRLAIRALVYHFDPADPEIIRNDPQSFISLIIPYFINYHPLDTQGHVNIRNDPQISIIQL